MQRSALTRYLNEVVNEYKNKPYEYWDTVELPVNFQRTYEGKEVQFEINMLESTPDYKELDVWATAGGLSDYFPSGQSFIVRKAK